MIVFSTSLAAIKDDDNVGDLSEDWLMRGDKHTNVIMKNIKLCIK